MTSRTRSVRTATTLDHFRRSRFLASTTLCTTLLSLLGPLVPRTALAQAVDGTTNPGNSPASLGPSNAGIQQGQTSLGVPETGPASSSLATWSVDPSTGAFSASVPFAMPTARGAVQPTLSLVYSSSGNHGVGGQGWSLGLPSIERHNLSGAPQYITDPVGGANIDPATQDRFAFGGQPLIPICRVVGTATASCAPLQTGADGVPVTETMPAWATGWIYYRLETETGSNLRFFWSPTHQTWVVQEPSGAAMEFGVPQDDPSDTGGVDTAPFAALGTVQCALTTCAAGQQCTCDATCTKGGGITLAGTCATPAVPYVFRFNLVRHYDAQRTGGASTGKPINLIKYAWSRLPVTSPLGGSTPTGTAPLADLTDIYDTPPLNVGFPVPAPYFAHHTHLSYDTSLGFVANPTRIERAVHRSYLTGVDMTSQTYNGSWNAGGREQVRRYLLSYAPQGHELALSQVKLDGWCSPAGAQVENDTTFLLPPEPATGLPACGSGPQHNEWPPATTFTYAATPFTPTFTPLKPTFARKPPTPPALFDVNADGLPDLVDVQTVRPNPLAPSVTTSTVWLNSASTPTTPSTWTSAPMNLASPTLGATLATMQPFNHSYVGGGFLNDGHVGALWFDPQWANSLLQSSTSVSYAAFSPRPVGSPPTAFDWGTPASLPPSAIFPEELQNCGTKTSWYQGANVTYAVCGLGPWVYLGADEPYAPLDIDGDGLPDLLQTSVFAATIYSGSPYDDGRSAYYPFVNVKFSTRDSKGVVAPFSSPAPPDPNFSFYVNALPNFCVGPRPSTCLTYPQGILNAPGPPAGCGVIPPSAPSGPGVGVTQANTFGDINGDGLPDWITLYQDHFTVSYGHGDGVFGVCADGSLDCGCDRAQPVTFSTSGTNNQWGGPWNPVNPLDSDLNAQFHDVDGDGFDDAIVPTSVGFNVFFIRSTLGTPTALPVNLLGPNGLGWSVVNTPGYYPPTDSSYMFADMDASGVDDVVVESPSGQMGYVNVLGGDRPGLLEGIRVTNGLYTSIIYKNLPTISQESLGTSNAWTTQSPQSIHVVTDVIVSDATPGVPPMPPLETEFTYTNPIYDGRDRQFVGFSSVEQIQVGDTTAPSMHTKTTFYQAHCNDSATSTACPQTPDYPNHSMRGLPVLTEIYGDQTYNSDARPTGAALSSVHRSFRETALYMGLDLRGVHRVSVQSVDTFSYDNTSPVVRATWAPVLVDVYTDEGILARSSFFISSTAAHTLMVYYPTDRWGIGQSVEDFGQVDGNDSSIDGIVSTIVTSSPDTHDATDNWIWRPNTMTREGYATATAAAPPRTVSFTYDPRGNLLLEQAPLSGELPMARSTTLSLPDGGVTAPPTASAPPGASSLTPGLVTLAAYTMDPSGTGNVTRVQSAASRCQDITYSGDPLYSQLPSASTVYTGGCGVSGLTTLFLDYARGLNLVNSSSTPDGALTTVAHDPFGRLAKLFRPDPATPSFSEILPGVVVAYNDIATPRTVETTVNDGTSSQVSWSVLDGYGRSILEAAPADTTAGDPLPWILSGQAQRNMRGLVFSASQTSFSSAWNTPASLTPSVPVRTLQYDPFGRVTGATDWNRTPTLARSYQALGFTEQDAAQIAPVSNVSSAAQETTVQFNGHGQKTQVVEFTGALTGVQTNIGYLPTGEPWTIARVGYDASGTEYNYQRWMQYDSLGRMVLNAEPATSTGFSVPTAYPGTSAPPASLRAWTYAYNDAGQLVASTDARGCGKNIAYDGAGRPVYEDYFPCTASQPTYSTPNPATGAGAEVFYTYDSAGRTSDVYDRAAHTRYGYDYRSRVTSVQRNVVQPNVVPTPAAGYTSSSFEQQFAYDDLDHLIGQSTGETPDVPYLSGASVPLGSSTSTSAVLLNYSARGVLESVNGSYGTLIQGAQYDADGLPHMTTWGDVAATATNYTYDNRRRIQEIRTNRSAPTLWTSPPPAPSPYVPPPALPVTTTALLLQDDVFTLDPVGNPANIADNRHTFEWPSTAQPVARGFFYDGAYRLTSATYAYPGGNAYASPTPTATVGSPFPLQTPPAPATRIGSESFTYDPFGNRTSTTDGQGLFFDRSLGPITLGTSGSSSTNQIASAGAGASAQSGVVTSYDAAGNLVHLSVLRGGACESGLGCNQFFDYQWDEVGRLAIARRYDFVGGETCRRLPPGVPPFVVCTPNPLPTNTPYAAILEMTPGADVQFTYDGSGERVVRTSTIHTAAVTTPYYTVDVFPSLRLADTTFGVSAAGNYDRSPSTDQVTLVAGGMALGRVVVADADPKTSAEEWTGHHVFLELTDHLGSTNTVIDQATSELVERTTYSAFGRIESDYSPARWESFRESYKFTGKEDDTALGITYFGARYYSPYLGTWISPDPLAIHGLGGDLNPYAYVHGRTLSATDPFGLDCAENNSCPVSWAFMPFNPAWFTSISISNPFAGWHPFGGGSSAPAVPRNPGNQTPREPIQINWWRLIDPSGAGYAAWNNALVAADPGAPGLDRLASGVLAVGAIAPVTDLEEGVAQLGVRMNADAVAMADTAAVQAMKGVEGVGEGIYEFSASTGKTYVGQSVDVASRLGQHLDTGNLLAEDLDTVETTAVQGGKLAREIAEQQRINELGGVQNLQNIRNPIGPVRQHLMPDNWVEVDEQ